MTFRGTVYLVLDAGALACYHYLTHHSSLTTRSHLHVQDADAGRDAAFVENVNRLLQDPEAIPIWPAPPATSSTQAGPSSSST